MKNRLHVKVAVYLIVERAGSYLFLQRCNTGYCDGLYSLPAGHVDPGETPRHALSRESQEEVDIRVEPDDLDLVHVIFRRNGYLNLFFRATQWQGEPKNQEPDKCRELVWRTLPQMVDRLAPEVAAALCGLEAGQLYTELPL
jgi:8-oxo-dGTP diphosphatase